MSRYKTLAAASFALVLLAACGSTGLGDILGGGGSTGNNNGNYEIRGVVDSVDTSSRSVYLRNVSGLTNMLSNSGSGSGNTARVYFDENTTVDYQGKAYRPENLERGDEVTVSVDESGNQLIAQRMTVTHNANNSSGSTYPSTGSGTNTSTVRGTVRYVDTNRSTIEVDRGSGSTVFVEFESNTPVYYSNQTYRATDLERGDEIDVRVRDLGNGRLVADQVSVVRSVSGSGGLSNGSTGSSSNLANVRGTVRSVDTSRRTIQLESTSWLNNFTGNTGTGSTITVYYDSTASINVNGTMQAISGLERGDVIEVQLRSSGNTYVADRLFLVRDVNAR